MKGWEFLRILDVETHNRVDRRADIHFGIPEWVNPTADKMSALRESTAWVGRIS
jgi:hypothetical protein